MKKIIVISLIILIGAFVYARQSNKDYYDLIVVSGATPLAVSKRVPDSMSLTVTGLVRKEYVFSGSTLNGFSSTRLRTREFSAGGEFQGAYAYLGIPVFHILEGISPKKPDSANFNQPLDIMVSFISKTGASSTFSFNEIIMATDQLPITLAYDRKPLAPTNEQALKTYKWNKHKENITGLRLICPKEPDTSRYLDDVVQISYTTLPTPDDILPERKKPFHCVSNGIACVEKTTIWPANLAGVVHKNNAHWVRIGHGHGYEEVVSVSGYELISFLKSNFPGCHDKDYFLFVACDGYRCLFSGREIFSTIDGHHMMIINSLNGSMPKDGFMLGPTADFFADRAMWGLSHVVRIKKQKGDSN